ncbi:MAG: DNA repair protein RecO [Candidatus Berkelbacteria bacterium Licking1014_2]|uniref:DNA repair protein RecO n=1 Tax=Candidatus Berkelbacteria bacterium Licking1014_2 TaxID=2017146 RepID=A0A554LV78_9BACT|nr:MAG: DNA repair protein RecO [Candidatus Berkelbacteria bacterium Licking1014_2]
MITRRDCGEADRLVIFFSPNKGQLKLIAPNSRRPQAVLAGQIEPFYHLALVCRQRSSGWDKIESINIINTFPNLRQSLQTIRLAAALGRPIKKIIQPGQANHELFGLLLKSLIVIDRQPADWRANPQLFLAWFYCRLLVILGYQPQLENRPAISPTFFDIANGRLTGDNSLANLLSITDNEIKLMTALLVAGDWPKVALGAKVAVGDIDQAIAKSVRDKAITILKFHLDDYLPS